MFALIFPSFPFYSFLIYDAIYEHLTSTSILAQTFLDLEYVIKQMEDEEAQLAEAMVEEKKEDKAEKKVDKK